MVPEAVAEPCLAHRVLVDACRPSEQSESGASDGVRLDAAADDLSVHQQRLAAVAAGKSAAQVLDGPARVDPAADALFPYSEPTELLDESARYRPVGDPSAEQSSAAVVPVASVCLGPVDAQFSRPEHFVVPSESQAFLSELRKP